MTTGRRSRAGRSPTGRRPQRLPEGWLSLPEGVDCLEDPVTSPDFRGCRAVVNAGFVHTATLEVTRLGPRVRIKLSHSGAGVGAQLHERLAR